MLFVFLFRFASFLACIAVILGAFVYHTLKDSLLPYQLDVMEIGVFYQLTHALALLSCTIFAGFIKDTKILKYITFSCIMFSLGIVLFSGSLYLLVFTGIKLFGPITPIGGLFLILGWITLFISPISKSYLNKIKEEK